MNPHGCQLAAPLCGLRAGRPQLGRVRTLAQGGGGPHGGRATPDLGSPEHFRFGIFSGDFFISSVILDERGVFHSLFHFSLAILKFVV